MPKNITRSRSLPALAAFAAAGLTAGLVAAAPPAQAATSLIPSWTYCDDNWVAVLDVAGGGYYDQMKVCADTGTLNGIPAIQVKVRYLRHPRNRSGTICVDSWLLRNGVKIADDNWINAPGDACAWVDAGGGRWLAHTNVAGDVSGHEPYQAIARPDWLFTYSEVDFVT